MPIFSVNSKSLFLKLVREYDSIVCIFTSAKVPMSLEIIKYVNYGYQNIINVRTDLCNIDMEKEIGVSRLPLIILYQNGTVVSHIHEIEEIPALFALYEPIIAKGNQSHLEKNRRDRILRQLNSGPHPLLK